MLDSTWWRTVRISATRRLSVWPFLVAVLVLAVTHAHMAWRDRAPHAPTPILHQAEIPPDPLERAPRLRVLDAPTPMNGSTAPMRAFGWMAALFLTSELNSERRNAGLIGESAAPRAPWRLGAALGDAAVGSLSFAAALGLFLTLPTTRAFAWGLLGDRSPHPALLAALWPFAVVPPARRPQALWPLIILVPGLLFFATGSSFVPLFGAIGSLWDPGVTAGFVAWHLAWGLATLVFVLRD
jgi:hypothetical protein